MNLGGIDRRLAALEERARPRVLVTLADFVLWRAKWRRRIKEEVELDPVLRKAFGNLLSVPRGDDGEA
jgi:hypothetical protein